MAQKREMEFDSLYGGMGSVDDDEMLEGNKDMLVNNDDEIKTDQVKLKEGKELKADNEISINGNGYHISF